MDISSKPNAKFLRNVQHFKA